MGVSPTSARTPGVPAARCPGRAERLRALPAPCPACTMPCLHCALPASCSASSMPCLHRPLPALCAACTPTQPGGGRAEPGPVCHPKLSEKGIGTLTHSHRAPPENPRSGQPQRCVCAAQLPAAAQAGGTVRAPGAEARIFRTRVAPRNARQASHARKTKRGCAAVGCQRAGPTVGAARPPSGSAGPGGAKQSEGLVPPNGAAGWGRGAAGRDLSLLEKENKMKEKGPK